MLYQTSKKIEEAKLSNEDKIVITNEFLSNYLKFDKTSGNPIEEKKTIEKLIDFVLYSDTY